MRAIGQHHVEREHLVDGHVGQAHVGLAAGQAELADAGLGAPVADTLGDLGGERGRQGRAQHSRWSHVEPVFRTEGWYVCPAEVTEIAAVEHQEVVGAQLLSKRLVNEGGVHRHFGHSQRLQLLRLRGLQLGKPGQVAPRVFRGLLSQLLYYCLDVTDEPAMAALFAEIEAEWGGLDTLCANAGIAGPTALVEDIALADWRACLAVNLEGAFLAAKYAAPMMKRQGAGVMLLTSSTVGLTGYPRRAPYAAAKWAVLGLMKTLAMELGPHGIRANALCPGAVEGLRMEAVMDREAAAKGLTRQEIHDAYASGTSMRTWVTGADIANMAVFLASPEARFVSGQVIAVDGHTFNPDPKV